MTQKPGAAAHIAAFILIALGIAADQLSKHWVLHNLPGRHAMEIIPGCLSFAYAENRNMAFGIGRFIPESVKLFLLVALTSALAAVLIVMLCRTRETGMRIALILAVSGALGNIIDRVRLGFVVDFIYWHGGFTWPNFNVADSFICVGVGLMMVLMFRRPEEGPSPQGASSEDQAADKGGDAGGEGLSGGAGARPL